MPQFTALGLSQPLTKALQEAGYTVPTPIQAQAIKPIVEGRDVLGIAQTGTGKTGAFALPLLEQLLARPAKPIPGRMRILVLTPTRELAAQVEASFKKYGKNQPLRTAVIFGGVGQGKQVAALDRGLDVLVATPGRLLDLMEQRHARLDKVQHFVLDEADRMMDMGFIRDIRKIVTALPPVRQTLLFSATMPDEIAHLAAEQLKDPVRVEVTPQASTVDRIAQRLCFVDKSRKRDLLRHFLADKAIYQALVFTRTKHGADRVAEDLAAHGIVSEAIHGNKAQNHRERTLRSFRAGALRVLVATDIAARGLDIPGVSHVFNFDLPDEPESYVHRIGRTARAGRDGIAIAFCAGDELEQLRDIERVTGQEIPLDAAQPMHINLTRMAGRGQSSGPRSHGGGQRRPQGGHQHQARHQSPRSAEPRGPRPELRQDLGERRTDAPRPDGGQGRRDRPRHEGAREARNGGGAAAASQRSQGSGSGQGDGPRRRRRNPGQASSGGQGIGNRPAEGGVSGFFGAIKRKLGGH